MGQIAGRLRHARKAAGYNQSVGVPAGLQQATLSLWERGNEPGALAQVAYLADKYGVSTDWLLGLTDDMAPAMGRDLPAHGAAMLEIMRQLPEWWQQLVLAQAQAVLDAHHKELARRLAREKLRANIPPNEYEQILARFETLILAGEFEAAVNYFESAVAPHFSGSGDESVDKVE